MANIFSNMLNSAVDTLASKLAPYLNDAMGKRSNILANYYSGDQRPQLKTKVGQQDDNLIENFIGLAVDRSVSRLFRGGVEFNLPDGSDKQQEYIDHVWDINKKEIILYQVGLHGAVYGTTYFKVCPDEIIDPFDGNVYPRLVPIDPEIIRIQTAPADMNDIEKYTIEYTITKITADGSAIETGYREVTRQAASGEMGANENGVDEALDEGTWVIEEWEQSSVYGNQWEMTSSTPWNYDFPPIIHWKNLPSLKSCYGDSEIDDVINVQDKHNFVTSNTGKIIKFHAHPETIGTGFTVDQLKKLDSSVGSFHAISNPDAKVFNLEMQSNLASSIDFASGLRNAIFDIAREVDMSSASTHDRLGSMTNFGLKILFSDAIDKNDTKRQLYGDALKELNRRLLVLHNWEGPASDPGEIKWQGPLPTNVTEEMTADQLALNMGIIDKKTIAERYITRYGVDWETIQANLADEGAAANANNSDIGAQILKYFTQGKGSGMGAADKAGMTGQNMTGMTQMTDTSMRQPVKAGQAPDQTGGMA